MKLSSLIKQLQNALDRHGDCEAFIEVPGDELEINHIESFRMNGDPAKPMLVAISSMEDVGI